MAEWLLKKFVKNYQQTERAEVHSAYGVLASAVGIICNLLLFLVKIIIGTISKSISVTSDAFNNLSDSASSVIGLVGVKMAEKPADKDHPFGHGRIEYIAAFIVSFLIMLVGWEFLTSSVNAIFHPEELVFSPISLIVLLCSVLGKVFLVYINKSLGKRVDSKVMQATAMDALGDICITLVTVASMAVYGIWHINIDGYAGVLVSFMILYAGFSVAKDTLQPLIGEAVDPELVEKVKSLVESHEGILGSHDLIIHSYGPNRYMASIHAEVPKDTDICVSHEIIDHIEREAKEQLGVFLVIHMDPVSNDERSLYFKEMIQEVLDSIEANISFHDFRYVYGIDQINLIFDIVVPHSLKPGEERKLLQEIQEGVNQKDKRCQCVITVDYSFTGEKQ